MLLNSVGLLIAARGKTRKADQDKRILSLDRLDRHLAALDAVVEDKLRRVQAAPAVVDSGFLGALDRVVEGQRSAGATLKETLGQAPRDVQHDLGVSLEAIQQAQERVRAALESALTSGSGDGP